MMVNERGVLPAATVGGGRVMRGGPWGMLGSAILASSSTGQHGPGLAANDGLNPSLRYLYVFESRSGPGVVLYPDSSHSGPVPYSGTIRLFQQGVGEVQATAQARSFSVAVAAPVVTAPQITQQPQPLTVAEQAPAAFAVQASGTAPLAYQWRRGGVDIAGAVGPSYTLPSAQQSDNGVGFAVAVSNAAGSVVSASALLTVQAPLLAPVIAAQPQGVAVVDGAQVALSVVASGSAPLVYQWRRNGVAVVGATGSSHSFAASAASGGAYTVLVSNSQGAVESAQAVVVVAPDLSTSPPTIAVQPVSASWGAGETAIYSVVAAGAQPLAYQWRRDGADITGANASSVSVVDVGLADHRSVLQCVVSNAYGQVTTRPVEILVPVVSLHAAKIGARIDDDRFDADIPRWVDAAVRLAEQFCNRYFTPKSPSFDRVDWPAAGETFPIGDATAVQVSYWSGVEWLSMPSGAVLVFADGSRTGVALSAGHSWPVLGDVAGWPRVRLRFAAGPASAALLPVEVEHFVIAHVSLWADENRAAAPQAAQNFPWLYSGLEPLKVY